MAGEIREKCAVAGVLTADAEVEASGVVFEALYAMQHRGPEASGMASLLPDGSLEGHRGPGLVRDVFTEEDVLRLAGSVAVGQNLYTTNGNKGKHLQPVWDKALGEAFAHNGNLPDIEDLSKHLEKHNIRAQDANDSEMMNLAIAQNMRSGMDLPDAIEKAYPLFKGAFSCVALHDGMLVAFRDPMGIRPLALGSFDDNGYMVASETCGLEIVGANYEREIKPGEMMIITEDGLQSKQLAEGQEKLDLFEFIYFARHDSYLYSEKVNEVRYRLGQQLAEQHPPITDDPDNIVVIPVPDTSIPVAEGYAEALGLRHRQGIIKNRYIGRTFLSPTQNMRKRQLKRKHNVVAEMIKGRDVIIPDDSVVRMNTLPRLVELVRLSGARTVTVLVSSPPVRFSDYYGIDTPKQSELAAANMTTEEMRKQMDCDYLGFLSLSRTIRATKQPASRLNLSCFTGEYPIDIGHHKYDIRTPVSMEYID